MIDCRIVDMDIRLNTSKIRVFRYFIRYTKILLKYKIQCVFYSVGNF